MTIEMTHIPRECQASAAASMLATKKLDAWVFVPVDAKGRCNNPPFKFDLRFGKEAELSDAQLFDEFGGDNFRGVA